MKYLATPECQDRVAQEARVFPAIAEASETAIAAFNEIGVNAEAFSVHLEEGTTVPSPVVDRWAQLTAIMRPAMDSVMSFGAEPDALVAAGERVNELWE
ncbi:hypothetical protein HN289_21340 [Acinetobacter baumannii]|nr:hypothetical protein [Acinetobacter baumannii]